MSKAIKILLPSLLSGVFLFFYLLVSETRSFRLSDKSGIFLVYFLLFIILLGFALSFVNEKIAQKTKFKENFALWFFTIYPLDLLLTGILLFLSAKLFNIIFFNNISFDIFYARNNDLALKIIFLLLISLLVYLISEYFMSAYHRLMNLKLFGEKIAADKLRLNFEALENQLKPHYLFNNLNTISALIYTDKSKAESFIRQLAETYQYVLNCSNKKLVSLHEELEFIEAYTYLMKTRYENALKININIEEHAKNGLIVPLSIQLLVENALKHNHITEEEVLHINIYTKNDYLIVENSLNSSSGILRTDKLLLTNVRKAESHKIGLKNIADRYKLISNKEIKISKNDTFKVEIPILNVNV